MTYFDLENTRRYCINPLYEIETAFKCDCHGCESIIDDLTDDYNEWNENQNE